MPTQGVTSSPAFSALSAPVAWLKRDSIAGVLADTDDVRPWNQGKRKVVRVDPAPHPDIEVVEAHVSHADPDLPRADDRIVHLHDAKNFWATVLIDSNRFHANAL